MTAISDRERSYIAAQAADARVNVEIETEGMTLNIGPSTRLPTARCASSQSSTASRSLLPIRSWVTCTAATRSSPRSAPTRRSHPDQPHRLGGQLCQ